MIILLQLAQKECGVHGLYVYYKCEVILAVQ